MITFTYLHCCEASLWLQMFVWSSLLWYGVGKQQASPRSQYSWWLSQNGCPSPMGRLLRNHWIEDEADIEGIQAPFLASCVCVLWCEITQHHLQAVSSAYQFGVNTISQHDGLPIQPNARPTLPRDLSLGSLNDDSGNMRIKTYINHGHPLKLGLCLDKAFASTFSPTISYPPRATDN